MKDLQKELDLDWLSDIQGDCIEEGYYLETILENDRILLENGIDWISENYSRETIYQLILARFKKM
mgnify:CR=1 FL=1